MHEVAHVQLGGASQHLRDACPIIAPRAAGQVSRVDELLIRMRDAGGRIIAPGQILPTAEGQIGQIDEWVARRAGEFAGRGHAVTMNLSAASLARTDMADVIESALAGQSADPANLVLEFTETSLLRDEARARRFSERIAALGALIALDDFGTGYSGFTYLQRVLVHYLKIDREFVRGIRSDNASRHVVRAAVSLAGGVGQQTVAQGVERRATVNLLCDLGVDYEQGYALGRPAPAESLLSGRHHQ
jgi:EAL domain-containing protein (putative c-di-GMP-specific phosphodiesterase class I)